MENMIHFSDTHLSDLFKDVHGFRPRHMAEWWTPADLEAEYDRLQAELKVVMDNEKKAQEEALVRFDELIQETINYGAADRETAIRWLMDAEGVDIAYKQEVEHFFWKYGLSWEIISEYTQKVVDNLS